MAKDSILDLQVLGTKELIRQLDGVKDAVRNRIMRKALYQAATVLRDEARRRVPVRSGALKKQIVARTDRDPENPGSYAGYMTIAKGSFMIVATDKGGKLMSSKSAIKRGLKGKKVDPRRYAHLVEYGTRPHRMGKGSVGKEKAKRGKVVERGAEHPGAPSKPFLRPALEAKRSQAFEAMRRTLIREVVAESAKRLGAM